MSNEDLRAAAEWATPARIGGDRPTDRPGECTCQLCGFAFVGGPMDTLCEGCDALEAFQHAANPARILSLLAELERKTAALERAADTMTAMVEIADQARDEWDAAPQGMKAGKILVALAGHAPGYRHDIDAIHANIAATRTALEPTHGD